MPTKEQPIRNTVAEPSGTLQEPPAIASWFCAAVDPSHICQNIHAILAIAGQARIAPEALLTLEPPKRGLKLARSQCHGRQAPPLRADELYRGFLPCSRRAPDLSGRWPAVRTRGASLLFRSRQTEARLDRSGAGRRSIDPVVPDQTQKHVRSPHSSRQPGRRKLDCENLPGTNRQPREASQSLFPWHSSGQLAQGKICQGGRY